MVGWQRGYAFACRNYYEVSESIRVRIPSPPHKLDIWGDQHFLIHKNIAGTR